MGLVDHVSQLCPFLYFTSSHKRPKDLQTVEIRIKMDCQGCVTRVRKSVQYMNGVSSVYVDQKQHKLTVIGYVDPTKVLHRVRRKTGKTAVFWPYVPYDTLYHPYVAGAYDKGAPAGYVRNVVDNPAVAHLARASSMEVRYLTAFSDDNANSCVVM